METTSIADLIRGIERLDESRLIKFADRHSDNDGRTSVVEIDKYLADNYPKPWSSADTVQRVKQALTDGTPLVDAETRREYQFEMAKPMRALSESEHAKNNPPQQEPRQEESCPDMTGATSGYCKKRNGRVEFSVVSRPPQRVKRETVVIVCRDRPPMRTLPVVDVMNLLLGNDVSRHPPITTTRGRKDAIEPCTRSAYVYCQ